MNLKDPINIEQVQGAVREHRDLMTTLDAEAASKVLQHFTPIPGVKDSITLGRTTLGKVSRKYTGQFIGQKEAGVVVPRTLTVYPCVMEMDDEPERYRRAYITEVKGGLDPEYHPFEIWLLNYGIKCASKELHDVIMIAKVDDTTGKTELKDSFYGLGAIIEDEKTAGNISVAKGNMFTTATFTRANIGDELLKMYRHMPSTFRDKENVKMFISADLGDLYDDWLEDQGVIVLGSGPGNETAATKYLRNTQQKCELVRLTNMPEGSQMVILTTKLNACYGYDSEADMSSMMPFQSGNPYHFTAAGKYVFGMQFVTLDKSEFCVNSEPLVPVTGADAGEQADSDAGEQAGNDATVGDGQEGDGQ